MKETRGIRIACAPAMMEDLQSRLIVAQLRPATFDETRLFNSQTNAILPLPPFRKPSMDQVRNFVATDATHPRLQVHLVRSELAGADVKSLEDRVRDQGFLSPDGTAYMVLHGMKGTPAGVIRSAPNLPITTTIPEDGNEHFSGSTENPPGSYVGLHLDNHDRLSGAARIQESRLRFLHNAGDGDRILLFVPSVNAVDIAEGLAPEDRSFIPRTRDARRYLADNPANLECVGLTYRKGEAVIFPSENAVHEGSTLVADPLEGMFAGGSTALAFLEEPSARWDIDRLRDVSLLHPQRESIDIIIPTRTTTGDEVVSHNQEKEEIPGIPFTEFILPIDQRCNLACDYCVVYQAVDKSFQTKPQIMSDEIIAQAAERIGEHAQTHNLPEVNIVLHGGEPTLRAIQDPTFFRRTVETIRQAVPESTSINFSLQSNAALFAKHPEIVEELNDLGISVGVSLDGDRQANRHRINHAGKESYDDVVEGLRVLQQYPDIYGGILCVVDPTTDPLATYEALCSFNPPMIDFNLPHKTWSSEQPPDMQATVYSDWLLQIYNQWQQDKARGKKVPDIRMFHSIINSIHGGNSMVETIGLTPPSNIVIETDGTYEKNQAYKVAFPGAPELGMNITEHSLDDVLRHPDIVTIQEGESSRSDICKECVVFDICGAGLCAHRHSAVDVPEKGLKQGFQNPSSYCADLKTMIGSIISSEYEATRRQLVDVGIDYYMRSLWGEGRDSYAAIMRGVRIAQACQRDQQEPKVFGKILMEEMKSDAELHDRLTRMTRQSLGIPSDRYRDDSTYQIRESFVWAQRMMVLDKEDFERISSKFRIITSLGTQGLKERYYNLRHDVLYTIAKKTEDGPRGYYNDWGELLFAETAAA